MKLENSAVFFTKFMGLLNFFFKEHIVLNILKINLKKNRIWTYLMWQFMEKYAMHKEIYIFVFINHFIFN